MVNVGLNLCEYPVNKPTGSSFQRVVYAGFKGLSFTNKALQIIATV